MTDVPTYDHCERPYRGDEGCTDGLPHAYLFGLEPREHFGIEREPVGEGDRCVGCSATYLSPHHPDCLHSYCKLCDAQAVFCSGEPGGCDPGWNPEDAP